MGALYDGSSTTLEGVELSPLVFSSPVSGEFCVSLLGGVVFCSGCLLYMASVSQDRPGHEQH